MCNLIALLDVRKRAQGNKLKPGATAWQRASMEWVGDYPILPTNQALRAFLSHSSAGQQ